jgi:hypothetical protein
MRVLQSKFITIPIAICWVLAGALLDSETSWKVNVGFGSLVAGTLLLLGNLKTEDRMAGPLHEMTKRALAAESGQFNLTASHTETQMLELLDTIRAAMCPQFDAASEIEFENRVRVALYVVKENPSRLEREFGEGFDSPGELFLNHLPAGRAWKTNERQYFPPKNWKHGTDAYKHTKFVTPNWYEKAAERAKVELAEPIRFNNKVIAVLTIDDCCVPGRAEPWSRADECLNTHRTDWRNSIVEHLTTIRETKGLGKERQALLAELTGESNA